MASPYDLFKTDPMTETEGLTLDYGDFQIRIARAGGANRGFVRALEARLKPYRRQLQSETLDEQVAERILREVYADHVILGWQGVADGDGKAMAFSRANVLKLLSDLPELFRDLQEQAGRIALFRAQELEDAKGNSRARSAGS
jgi:hypothetical protein